MAYQAPQSVLDYYRGYSPFAATFGGGDPGQYGGWFADRMNQDPSKRFFTDESGYMWMPQIEGQSPVSDGDPGSMGTFTGFRSGINPGETPGLIQGTNNYYDPTGQFQYSNTDDVGWLNPVTGVLAVFGAALGAGALGAATGAGGAATAAGTGAAAGTTAGAVDLGGGLMMGADGAITGSTLAGGGTLTNAEIAAMASGSGYGGSGALGAAGELGATGGSAFNPAVDSQLYNASIGDANALGGYSAAGTPSIAGGAGGTPPPANPYASGGGIMDSLGNMSTGQMMGLGSSVLGALGGAQGQQANSTSSRSMDPRMDSLFYGDLAPRTQGLLGQQMPAAYGAGNQMLQVGSGLLGRTSVDTPTNPYLQGRANDMQLRTKEMLDQNNLSIQGNAVGYGGLGGSRQGVAQGIAAGKAADYLQGNLANMYGNAYDQDQNRLRQDWTLGAGLMNQGLNTQFQPLQNTANIYAPFNGFGTTTNNQQTGGGWQGAVGGALTGAALGKQMGWW